MNEYEIGVTHRFAAFCKKVLKLSAYKWHAKRKKHEEREISLSLVCEEYAMEFQDPKEYFEYVIQNTPTVERDKILVVGDSQSSDILGGINAGLDTCWVAPEEQENKYNATFHISSLDELKSIIL